MMNTSFDMSIEGPKKKKKNKTLNGDILDAIFNFT